MTAIGMGESNPIADNSTVNQQLQVLATEFKKFLGHKEQGPELKNIVEGEHVFINEDGTGEWIDGRETTQ